MDTPMDRLFFCDPGPDACSFEAIGNGMRTMSKVAPDLREIRERFTDRVDTSYRELFLDAAVVLLAEADRQWARGRVLEALALEGLEARLLEAVVGP
jgi:hypothetical protein